MNKTKRREAAKLYRQKKCRFDTQEVQELEILRDKNQTRKFYKGVSKRRTGFAPSTSFCNVKEGNLITDKGGVLNRWKEFFSELLNGSKVD